MRRPLEYRVAARVAAVVARVGVMSAGVSAVAVGQVPTPALTYDQLAEMRFLKDVEPVSMSPDGRWVAYTVEDRRAKLPEDSAHRYRTASGTPSYLVGSVVYVRRLDRRDDASGNGTALTALPVNSWGAAWSPDGSRLAFLSDEGGTLAVWTWDPASGERHSVSHVALKISPGTLLHWMSDGRALLVPAQPAADTAAAPGGAGSGAIPCAAGASVGSRLTVRVYRSPVDTTPSDTAAGDLPVAASARVDLVQLDMATGQARRLTSGPITWAEPSPRGDQVAYLVLRHGPRPTGAQYQSYSDLVVMSAGAGTSTVLARNLPMAFLGQVAWSPDGAWLAYRTGGTDAERGLFLVAASGHQPRVRARAGTRGFDRARQAPVWDVTGRAVYAVVGDSLWQFPVGDAAGAFIASFAGRSVKAILTSGHTARAWSPDGGRSLVVMAADTVGHTSAFYRVDVRSGRTRAMLVAERAYGLLGEYEAVETTAAMDGGDRVVYASETVGVAPDLWMTTRTFSRTERLTHLNPDLERVAMGARRVVEWTARSGERRHGLLLLPPGYREGTRIPLLVWVYERSMPYVNTFGLDGSQFYNLQLFATHGYAVLYPDVEWRRESVMAGLADQVLPGIDQVIALGIADSIRVGVFGHSSGGYDVMALVVQSQRFAAAVESSGWGAADLFSMYATSLEDGISQDWVQKQMGLGAAPWEAPERYVRNSPGYFLDRITAPLLILQGPDDDPEGARQSDALFAALRRLGKRVEYRRYEGEGHAPEWWSAANKADAAHRIMAWFDLYVARRQAEP